MVSRYNRDMFVAFIEAGGPGDEDDGRRAGEPWLLTAFDLLFPWPALIVWLCVASRYVDGWAGVGLIYAAIMLAAWRGLRTIPTDGLRDGHQ
jgi:hypothetical protein